MNARITSEIGVKTCNLTISKHPVSITVAAAAQLRSVLSIDRV